MNKLREMIESTDKLSKLLQDNASNHLNYKLYTSMDRALEFMLNGRLYLSNGSYWNDKPDRKQMENKEVYGRCFSYSTRENIAMWMLYGAENGKNGAALNFQRSIIRQILKIEEISVLKISPSKGAEQQIKLRKKTGDFCIYMTDVLYIDDVRAGTTIVTYGDEHIQVNRTLLENNDIFVKRYEWKYENECRLIVRVSPSIQRKISEISLTSEDGEKRPYINLAIDVPGFKNMKEERLIHSPVYKGNVLYGKKSSLNTQVDW